jgi:arsenite-transporting ATPase
MIPEDMAILETERLINDLNKYGIKVKQLIINNALKSEGCEFCREKKKEQEKYISRIKEKFENSNITIVPLNSREVKGLDSLNEFSKFLF